MENYSKEIDDIINYRRSVRIYDDEAPYNSEVVRKCIERATLAPNSSNMQLWEFIHVTSPEIKKKLATACFNQLAAKTAKELVVVVVRKDLWKKRAEFNYQKIKENLGDKKPEEYSSREKMALNYYKKVMPFIYFDFLGIFGFIKYIIAVITGIFRPMYRQVTASDIRIVAHKSVGLAAQTFMMSMAAEKYDTCPMEGFDSLRVKKILNLPHSAEINMIIACGIRKPEGIFTERYRVPFNEVYKKI
ncbi:MAG TPA: nitroreductase family protein [Flavobacteriales bacterium]|nr:nitroreductase family protein [Flavobacteriales bacterium]|tara:strand:- start:74773 stop:75510 length:738 start_codon:yes stop_codon:yes gene_type:complete